MIAPTLNAAFGDKQGLEDQHINGGGRCSYLPDAAACLTTGAGQRYDAETETLIPTGGRFDVAHTLCGEGFDASEDGTGRGTPLVAEYYSHDYCQDRIYSADAISPALNVSQSHKFRSPMGVRRLTPRECSRLQGFPDDYTLIPWRKKPAEDCPDGPRYKALGNSWAVPVVRWIGQRIKQATP